MQLNKLRVNKRSDNLLRQLKSKTQLTPNLLCRMAFCLSLRDPMPPNPADFRDEDGNHGREFNRYTLTGQWDPLFTALLRQRCKVDNIEGEQAQREQFIAHIDRGIQQLFQKVKTRADILRIVMDVQKQQ